MSTSPVPLDLQIKLSEWRKKVAEKTITLEEMKEAVVLLRAGRASALAASDSGKRKAAAKVIPSADALLDELGEL